jgi:hypothetical protein
LAEVERARSELQEKVIKLQQETESITQQLEDAEMKASAAIKSASNLESQLTESQQLLEEETRQKLALSSKLRQIESEKEALQEQLEEDEEMKKNYEKKLGDLNYTMAEMKKRAEEECEYFLDFFKFPEQSRRYPKLTEHLKFQPTLSRSSKNPRKSATRTSKPFNVKSRNCKRPMIVSTRAKRKSNLSWKTPPSNWKHNEQKCWIWKRNKRISIKFWLKRRR